MVPCVKLGGGERSRLSDLSRRFFRAKIVLKAWKGLRKDWLLRRDRPRSRSGRGFSISLLAVTGAPASIWVKAGETEEQTVHVIKERGWCERAGGQSTLHVRSGLTYTYVHIHGFKYILQIYRSKYSTSFTSITEIPN